MPDEYGKDFWREVDALASTEEGLGNIPVAQQLAVRLRDGLARLGIAVMRFREMNSQITFRQTDGYLVLDNMSVRPFRPDVYQSFAEIMEIEPDHVQKVISVILNDRKHWADLTGDVFRDVMLDLGISSLSGEKEGAYIGWDISEGYVVKEFRFESIRIETMTEESREKITKMSATHVRFTL